MPAILQRSSRFLAQLDSAQSFCNAEMHFFNLKISVPGEAQNANHGNEKKQETVTGSFSGV